MLQHSPIINIRAIKITTLKHYKSMKKLLNLKRRADSGIKLSFKMKLSTLIMFVVFFSLQANTTYAQRTITLDLENVTVKTVLDQLEIHTDYRIVYKIKDVDLSRKVNIKVKNQHVTAVVEGIFDTSGTDYHIVDQQIFLVAASVPVAVDEADESSIEQQVVVLGAVMDETGFPLPGASMVEKGTTNGTQSDFDGNFTLSVGDPNAVLVISYIGFFTKEVPLSGQTSLSVTLMESASSLDEVVVTALGISRDKKGLGYAVQEIKGDDMNEARETNFVNSLSGKIAGVSISTSGAVGSSSRIVIRGENSLNFNGNNPLYVVDGVPTGNSETTNAS